MRRLGVAIALGLALCLAAPTVSAHSPGSPPITASGSFVLGRASGNNSAGTGPYMVFWDNPNNISENVAYSFVLLPPSPDLTVFVVFPVILAVIVLLLWAARRRPKRPAS